MRDPSISIVIATFMDADALKVTLESIRMQDAPPDLFETIVVDGASTDATGAVVESFAHMVDLYISETDDGVYDAMNKGARAAHGKWLHFLNAGDRFSDSRSLTQVFSALASVENRTAWVVAGALNLGAGRRPPVIIPNMPHRWWSHAWGWQPHCHQASWFAADAFRLMGGYDLEAGFVADFDLILRYGLLEAPLEIDRVVIHYEGGGMSEQRRAEIPALLHQVRNRRFGYGRRQRQWDARICRVLALLTGSRIKAGAVKQELAQRFRIEK